MSDPKDTIRIKLPTSNGAFQVYTSQVNHANLYANNIFANNLIVSGQSTGGGGAGGKTVLINTSNGSVNYNTNTNTKSDGAVVNFVFNENPGKTGHILANNFVITVSANNLIKDPAGAYLAENDTIEFNSVIANLRLISDGEYWYLTGDNSEISTAAGNNYVNDTFVSNVYATSTFTSNSYVISTYTSNTYATITYTSNTYVANIYASNNYLQAQLLAFEEGEVSNNYLQGVLTNYASNSYSTDTFTSNNYVADKYVANTYAQDAFDPAGTAVAMAIALG